MVIGVLFRRIIDAVLSELVEVTQITAQSPVTAQPQLHSIARVLLLLGGIVLILQALLSIVYSRSAIEITPNVRFVPELTDLTTIVAAVIVGVLALIATLRITSAPWSVVLVVLGLFIGGLGGTLVFIASLIALVALYVKP